MAFITSDFLKEVSTTTGTGNITLSGARVPGSTFASAIAVSDTFHYAISHESLNEWETGIGTMLTATTFSRSVLTSSNANALVNFSAGNKRVDVVLPSTRIKLYPGPVQIGATTMGSGTLSFAGTGVSFSLSTNTAGGTVHASAGGGGVANASISSMAAAITESITNATSTTISPSGLVLPAAPGTLNTRLSAANVNFFASGQSLAAAAWFDVAAGAGGGRVQNVSFAAANAVSFGADTTTTAGVFGAIGRVTANVPRVRQVQLYAPDVTQIGSVTDATDSTLSNSSAVTLNFPLLATNSNTIFSSANIQFRLSSDSLIGVAWQRYGAAAVAQHLSNSNANGVSLGFATTTSAALGRIVLLSASVDPRIGVVSHVGGNVVSSVTQLAFSNASNVTWSLSTAASAATVIASVAAGGGGGITAFALSNAASSVMATGLTFSNANGFSFLLSTGAGNAATLSGSYTVPTHTLAVSAAGNSVSNGTFVLSNSNNVSFGMAGSTITATVTHPNNQIGVVSHIGGNVVSSVSQLAFSNASNVTFSLSTAANAATVIASVAAGGGGGITASIWQPFQGVDVVQTVNTGAALASGRLWLSPLGVMPGRLEIDRFVNIISLSASTSQTASLTLSHLIGLYTKSGTALSSVHTTIGTLAFTFSGANNTAVQYGLRMITIPWTTTITEADYWIAFGSRLSMSSGNTGSITVSQLMFSQSVTNTIGIFGVATSGASSTAQYPIGAGIYSTTTSALPASIGFSQIIGGGSSVSSIAARRFHFFFQNGTA